MVSDIFLGQHYKAEAAAELTVELSPYIWFDSVAPNILYNGLYVYVRADKIKENIDLSHIPDEYKNLDIRVVDISSMPRKILKG